MDDASERAIEEDMLDQFNYFDDEDEELIDRREPASLDSFDLVDEETDEVEDESTEPPQSSRLDSLLSRAPMHHGVRARSEEHTSELQSPNASRMPSSA